MGSYRSSFGRNSAAAPRIGAWILFTTVLGGAGLVLGLTGIARPAQSAAQWLTEPLTVAVNGLTAPLADFAANVGSFGRLREENRTLRAENERLQVELARAREEGSRAAELADLLRIGNQLNGDQFTYAAIIARDAGPLRDVVAINRGTRDGVEEGMVVLGKGGALVGAVEKALDTRAWVRLITDPRSGVNARIQESRAPALASGSSDGRLRLEYLAQAAVVNAGDTVLTSGLGGSYPEGLLIGRVAKVEGGPLDVFKRVEVDPAVGLGSLETVAVLTSFRPLPIEGLGR
jgi:rod shape-determining protein MreC